MVIITDSLCRFWHSFISSHHWCSSNNILISPDRFSTAAASTRSYRPLTPVPSWTDWFLPLPAPLPICGNSITYLMHYRMCVPWFWSDCIGFCPLRGLLCSLMNPNRLDTLDACVLRGSCVAQLLLFTCFFVHISVAIGRKLWSENEKIKIKLPLTCYVYSLHFCDIFFAYRH